MTDLKLPSPPKLSPISDEETLLRRVPLSWYPDKKFPGHPSFEVFLPKRWQSEDDQGDHDGLSVNRESFTTVIKVAKHPDSGKEQHVLRTSVPKLRSIDLSIVEAPLDDDPSHALIREINSVDYKNKKKKAWIKNKARILAYELSEMAHICTASMDRQ